MTVRDRRGATPIRPVVSNDPPQDPLRAAIYEAVQHAIEPLQELLQELRQELRDAGAAKPARDHLKLTEAADYMRCSVRHVQRLIAANRLPRLHIGGRTFVARKALDEFIARGEPS